ncbi:MAG: GNAT family N-acetyltransferase [Candidatus Helarchaeota archaeon]
MITIRKAKIDDIDQLIPLMKVLCEHFNVVFYEKPWKMDLKFKLESSPDSVIVAVDLEFEEKIVGMVLIDIGRDPYSSQIIAQIYNFIIDPEYRTKGIGSKLIDSALEYCKAKKASVVRVNARRQVKEAIKLFQKKGFSEGFIVMEQELD